MPATGQPPLTHHVADGVPVRAGPVARPEDDGAPRLRVFEARLVRAAEADLRRIHDVQHQHLMTPMPQKAKRLERQGPVEQEVGHEHHQASSPKLTDHSSECGLRRGSLPRFQSGQRPEKLVPVAQARARRGDRANVVVEGDESGGIALADQHQGQSGDQSLRVGQLWGARWRVSRSRPSSGWCRTRSPLGDWSPPRTASRRAGRSGRGSSSPHSAARRPADTSGARRTPPRTRAGATDAAR